MRIQKNEFQAKNAAKLKIGIVVSQYYWDEITGPMLEGAKEILKLSKVSDKNITIVPVSGSWEITYGCVALLKKKKVDALITLGCIIKGETSHDHHISAAVSQGLTQLTIEKKIPIAYGVINANTLEQAIARNNKGREAAIAALEAALLKI